MTTLQPLLLEIDSTAETRRSTSAIMLIRRGGASAANRRQTGHGRAKDDGRRISRSGEKKGAKYDSELERLTAKREFHAEPRATVPEKCHPAMEIGEEEI
jgi:hypothetical protein